MSSIGDKPLTWGETLLGTALISPAIAGAGYGVGAVGAAIFTRINPLTAGLFGATTAVVMAFTAPIFFKLFENEEHPVRSDLLALTATIITSAAISKLIFSAAGAALTIGNAAALTAATFLGIPLFFIIAGIITFLVLGIPAFLIVLYQQRNQQGHPQET